MQQKTAGNLKERKRGDGGELGWGLTDTAARPQRAGSHGCHPWVPHPTRAASTSTRQVEVPVPHPQSQWLAPIPHPRHRDPTVGPFLPSLPQTPIPRGRRSPGAGVAARQSAAPGAAEAIAGTYWA